MRPQLRSRFRIAQPEDTSPPPMATPARTKSSAPNEQGLVLHAIALLVAGLMLRWGESETLLWCGGLLWETGGRLLGSYRPDYTSGERTVPTFFARFHVSRFPRLGQRSAVNCQSTQSCCALFRSNGCCTVGFFASEFNGNGLRIPIKVSSRLIR